MAHKFSIKSSYLLFNNASVDEVRFGMWVDKKVFFCLNHSCAKKGKGLCKREYTTNFYISCKKKILDASQKNCAHKTLKKMFTFLYHNP